MVMTRKKMRLRKSFVWTYSAQAINFLVTFSSTVVIARIVIPRDFGVFAMANAITTFISVFAGFGLARYITRESSVDRDFLRTVFTVNTLITLIYVLAILCGAWFARYINQSSEVARFLLVFAIFPVVAMMEFVPSSLCARDERFGIIAFLSVLRALVLAAVTIVMALQGYAYMSFAWAQVAAWAATSISYNAIIWRPDVWRLRFVGVRSVVSFGTQMIGISGLNQLSTRASEMALGSLLGLSNLGLYTRAAGLPSQLHANVYAAGSNVIFSRLSSEMREVGEFHATYLRFMRVILGLLWPMMFGLAIMAQPIIHILYGPKWQAAALPLSLLAVAYALIVATGMTSELFILKHATSRQVRIELLRSLVGLALFLGGAWFGLEWAAAAKIGEAGFAFVLYRKPMARMIGGPSSDPLRPIYIESSILTLMAVTPALILMISNAWSPTTPMWLAVSSIGAGGVLWGGTLMITKHPIYAEVCRLTGRVWAALFK